MSPRSTKLFFTILTILADAAVLLLLHTPGFGYYLCGILAIGMIAGVSILIVENKDSLLRQAGLGLVWGSLISITCMIALLFWAIAHMH